MLKGRTQPHIFVVDDEQVIASSLATILRHLGFGAKSFTDPLEALKTAQAEAPDLLISDVIMAHLSGIDLAIQVQSCCPDCKVLLFSGQAATADLLATARANGHDFELVSKPVHPKDLLSRIEQVTGERPPLPSIHELLAGL
ncbi:MAG: response regulator [Terracidiphilus sp.]